MICNDQEMLLKAIVKQPEEDTLRLIYADWLDENDQANQAEFIRKQIAYAKPAPFKPKCSPFGVMLRTAIPLLGAVSSTKELKEYKEALVQWNHDRVVYKSLPEQIHKLWLAKTWNAVPNKLSHLCNTWDYDDSTLYIEYWRSNLFRYIGNFTIAYHRGFPESLTCSMSGFMRCGEQILSSTPITKINIMDKAPENVDRGFSWVDRDVLSELKNSLPRPIFELLPTSEQSGFIEKSGQWLERHKKYANYKLAMAALSTACIECARLDRIFF